MPRKRKGNPVHGWVNFDKPLGMTSTQAVGKIRWLFKAQKAGHAGTLDPLASGILPIALGEATKTVPFMMDAQKEYEFTLTWGQNTDTWDSEGTVTQSSDIRPHKAAIEAVLPEFTGLISQTPPRFSAIKIAGKRAYDLARAGETIRLKSRAVTVTNFDLVDYAPDTAQFIVTCGKGTYIRSLARDIAAKLGACGHVTRLRRTRVGAFTQPISFSLDALENLAYEGRVLEALSPVKTALDDIPVLAAAEPDAKDLKYGRTIVCPLDLTTTPWVLVMNGDTPVALCQPKDGQLWPRRVFNM